MGSPLHVSKSFVALQKLQWFIQFHNFPTKSELDWYLEEPVLLWSKDFDILNWWRDKLSVSCSFQDGSWYFGYSIVSCCLIWSILHRAKTSWKKFNSPGAWLDECLDVYSELLGNWWLDCLLVVNLHSFILLIFVVYTVSALLDCLLMGTCVMVSCCFCIGLCI